MRVLMCGSDLHKVKGGMVSISQTYLQCPYWKDCKPVYYATHCEGMISKKILIFLSAYLRIFYDLIRHKLDAVLLNVSERGSVYRKIWIMKLCHLFSVPVIFHHHGAEFDDFYQLLSEKGKKKIEKAFTEVELNLVLSKSKKQEFQKTFPRANVEYLHNSVDVKAENPYRENASYIITMGRLGKRKGTYDFLKALHQLDPQLQETIKVVLCGDGEITQIQQLIREYGLEKRIEYVGWVNGEQKDHYLENAMMHVLPSYNEVLPMSILETMARGIPNISTAIAAIPEVIQDGYNGFLITPGDIELLKKRILELVKDRSLRYRMSGYAYDLICEQFSLKSNVEKLEEILKKEIFG